MSRESPPERRRTVVARFEIPYFRYLDAAGRPSAALPEFAAEPEALIPLYRAMVLARSFDEKAVALQRTGRLGTYASALGQEAIGVGVASAMAADDIFLPSFREHGGQLWRGVTLEELFLFWGGDERGNDFAGPRRDFPVSVPVASHIPHAAGVALACGLRGEARVAVAVCGDGATSKGDFYEALNLMGAWHLPAVVVINNNQWAISVPRAAQSAARTLAQKAVAAGIDGLQVDGNDVIAVREATARALARARAGGGPSLIECLSYRLSDHTTADDASRYRDDAEVSPRWKEEPVLRLRTFLVDRGAWDRAREDALIAECREAVEAAAAQYLATPPQPPESIFDYTYAALPADLEAQRAEMLARLGAGTSRSSEAGDG